MEELKNPYECLKERKHLEDLGVDGKYVKGKVVPVLN
jgi:hypothetical protein